MPLTLNCPKCSKAFRVRDEAIGQRVRCPNCQAIVQVPGAIAPASMADVPVMRDLPPAPPARPFAAVTQANLPQLRPGPAMTAQEREESIFGSAPQPRAGEVPAPPSLIVRDSARHPGALMTDTPMPADPAPAKRLPKAAKPVRQRQEASVPGDWRAAYSGLAWSRTGLFLILVGFLAWTGAQAWEAAIPKVNVSPVTWKHFDTDPLKAGLATAGVGLSALGLVILVLGRVQWLFAPIHLNARGLALGSLAMLVGGVGLFAYGVFEMLSGTGLWLGSTQPGGLYLSLGLLVLVLGELWALLWAGQVGARTAAPVTQFGVGLVPVLTIAAVLGADYLAPKISTGNVGLDVYLMAGATTIAAVVIFLTSYWVVLGLAKMGIRQAA